MNKMKNIKRMKKMKKKFSPYFLISSKLFNGVKKFKPKMQKLCTFKKTKTHLNKFYHGLKKIIYHFSQLK
jgi:hypothetical protein